MEIPNNVDGLLIESMSGQKLDPLPEKVAEVPRETTTTEHGLSAQEHPKGEAEVGDLHAKQADEGSRNTKEETNEYGDKSEPAREPAKPEPEANEYGLEAEAPKTYTKAEMDAYANQIVRDRLARLERNSGQQATPQQVQQHAQATQQGFQYDENSTLGWEQQLEQFVMQVADKREQTKAEQLKQAVEQVKLQEFESKFKSGMSKFNDYHEVVGRFDIKDDMLLAASDIRDPAALFYAAAKRMPDELEKISRMESDYARAAAIGRLDEKLRKQAVKVSNAPKPVSQTKGDTTNSYQAKPVQSNELDDLLVADQKSRVAQMNARRR